MLTGHEPDTTGQPPNRGRFVRFEEPDTNRTRPDTNDELGSSATGHEPDTTGQTFSGSGPAEGVDIPPLGGIHLGLRLSSTKIAKVGVMLAILARIKKVGIDVEPLQSLLESAAQQKPYDRTQILGEAERITALCRGEKLLSGSDLANAATRLLVAAQPKSEPIYEGRAETGEA